jgi:hypothetical protein
VGVHGRLLQRRRRHGPDLIDQAERIAQRLTDAASVKYLGDPPVEQSGVSGLLNYTEGRWMITYMEHWRHRKIYIVQVQYWRP